MVPQHSQDGNMSRSDFDNSAISSTTSNNVSNSNNGNATALNMFVQQQQQKSDVVFGSQRVDKNSSTPYSDATQVSFLLFVLYRGTHYINREFE